MIDTRVRQTAEARGIKSAYELQKALDLSPTVALRLWRGEVTRYSVETLDKLCTALECQTGDLLVYVPEKKGGKK
jgi:putative transcriptional regulator